MERGNLVIGIRPAESKHECGTIKFTLARIDRTSLIESEHFIVQIQQRYNELKSGSDTVARLRVQLRMSIGIDISVGPVRPKVSAIHEIVLVNICIVVSEAESGRKPAFLTLDFGFLRSISLCAIL